jgi:hypothetical protein
MHRIKLEKIIGSEGEKMEDKELLLKYKKDYFNDYREGFWDLEDIKNFLADVWGNMSDGLKKDCIEAFVNFIRSERNREPHFTVSERLEDGDEPVYSEILGKEFRDESDINLYICSDDYRNETNIDVIILRMEEQRSFDNGISYLGESHFESFDKLGSIIFSF